MTTRPREISYLGIRMKQSTYLAARTALIIICTIAGFALWAWSWLLAPHSWPGRNAWWVVLLFLTGLCVEAIVAHRILADSSTDTE